MIWGCLPCLLCLGFLLWEVGILVTYVPEIHGVSDEMPVWAGVGLWAGPAACPALMQFPMALAQHFQGSHCVLLFRCL